MPRLAPAALPLLLALPTAALPTAALASDWQVTGVNAGDSLNVRAGPATSYSVVSTLAPGAGGLQKDLCVYVKPSPDAAQSSDLPEWCAISRLGTALGWVNARFLGPAEIAPQAAQQAPEPGDSALPFLGPVEGYPGCTYLGENDLTNTFLDHSQDLIGCLDPSEGQEALSLVSDPLSTIGAYTLFSVPH